MSHVKKSQSESDKGEVNKHAFILITPFPMSIIRSTCLTMAIPFRQPHGYRPASTKRNRQTCTKKCDAKRGKLDEAGETEIYPNRTMCWFKICNIYLAEMVLKPYFVTVRHSNDAGAPLLWLKQGTNMAGISCLWGRMHYFEMWGEAMRFLGIKHTHTQKNIYVCVCVNKIQTGAFVLFFHQTDGKS